MTKKRRGKNGEGGAAAELETAGRHLKRLYDIGKLLSGFEGVTRTLPDVLTLASEVLEVRIAILIEEREGVPRTFSWRASGVAASEVRETKRLARASFGYLAGRSPSKEWLEGETTAADDTSDTLESLERHEEGRQVNVTLPLAVARRQVFGVLRMNCHRRLDEIDLAFLNALTNQLAIALDRNEARRLEVRLRKEAESLAQGRAESLLREQAALAEAKDALRARDAFIGAASHELRNPLGALALQLGLILKQTATSHDERVTTKLEAAQRQIGRMKRLVNNLLDVSRISSGRLDLELEDVAFDEVVHEVVERSAEEIEQSGSPVVVKAEAPVVGRWDRLRLDQILTNLLSNALKYGEGKPVAIRLRSDAEQAWLTVTDHGIGISEEDQERIFERFERAGDERSFVGFGLGLWIVRQIVDALGGTIEVTSRLGEGSSFTVKVPRRQRDEQPPRR